MDIPPMEGVSIDRKTAPHTPQSSGQYGMLHNEICAQLAPLQSSYWGNARERLLLSRSYHDIAPVVGWNRAVEIGMLVWNNASPPSKRKGRDTGRNGGFGALYVPQRIDASDTQKIVKLIGVEDARRLVAAFPGEQLFFQSIEAASLGRRNRAIAGQVSDGWRVAVVAVGFDLTDRQVRRICANERMATMTS